MKETKIQLIRCDLEGEQTCQEIPKENYPSNRAQLIEAFDLPSDSIIKLSHEDKLIPWSLVRHFPSVDIRVFRPHQNIKPRHTEDFAKTDGLVREKAESLESRISSIEQSLDETTLQIKTERDLQLLTKQISFLGRRLDEADQAEWIDRKAL